MSGTRVLVLDDEPLVAETLALLAQHAGHLARFTSDPDEFLALHRSWSPSHLILDLDMPGMDGLEVLGRLAGEDCTASIVISSGVHARVLEAAGLVAAEHGLRIAGVLAKPFGLANLSPLLRTDPDPVDPATGLPIGLGSDHAPLEPTQPRLDVRDLAAALDDPDGIAVAYQPKVDLLTGRTVGFEALARWRDARFGAVPPDLFVAMAEENGLIEQLTDRVMHAALSWTRVQALDHVKMSVNVSALSVGDPAFASRVLRRCQDNGMDPGAVILELTETASSEDAVTSLRNLTRLRIQGFSLSLDDFGTGYSSMTQLARLPVSEIKLDRSFVSTATTSAESRTLVASVVDLGRSLGLTTVAEGVEDRPTLDLLSELGCDLVQGYYLSRPLPPVQAAEWLRQHG